MDNSLELLEVICHGESCRSEDGHRERTATYFAGLDKNLSRSLVLIGVLGKRGRGVGMSQTSV
jgi:hypothetical protein